MTISISSLTAKANAPTGTVVGTLTARDPSGAYIACEYTTTKGSASFFAISGSNLVTEWSGSVPAGYYSVRIHAIGTNTSPQSEFVSFDCRVMRARARARAGREHSKKAPFGAFVACRLSGASEQQSNHPEAAQTIKSGAGMGLPLCTAASQAATAARVCVLRRTEKKW